MCSIIVEPRVSNTLWNMCLFSIVPNNIGMWIRRSAAGTQEIRLATRRTLYMLFQNDIIAPLNLLGNNSEPRLGFPSEPFSIQRTPISYYRGSCNWKHFDGNGFWPSAQVDKQKVIPTNVFVRPRCLDWHGEQGFPMRDIWDAQASGRIQK